MTTTPQPTLTFRCAAVDSPAASVGLSTWPTLVVLAMLVLWTPAARAQWPGPPDSASRSGPSVRQAFAEVAAPVARSTVSVLAGDRPAALGVVVSRQGHVLTKASELRGPVTVKLPDGRLYKASIVGCALEHDLAMIRLDRSAAAPSTSPSVLPIPSPWLTPVTFDAAEDAEVGRWVATVGTGPTPLAAGVISVGRRTIPADVVMGVLLQDHMAGIGAKVQEVSRGSGAARAGMISGDVIVGIDDAEVRSREDVTVVLAKKSPGQTVRVALERNGRREYLDVRLSMRPAPSARSARQNRMGGGLSERRAGFAAVLQHDMVSISPAQCGSAIVTLDGRVAGINIARAGRTETYAVPAAVVAALIPDLIAGKYPPTTNPSMRPETDPATAPSSQPAP